MNCRPVTLPEQIELIQNENIIEEVEGPASTEEPTPSPQELPSAEPKVDSEKENSSQVDEPAQPKMSKKRRITLPLERSNRKGQQDINENNIFSNEDKFSLIKRRRSNTTPNATVNNVKKRKPMKTDPVNVMVTIPLSIEQLSSSGSEQNASPIKNSTQDVQQLLPELDDSDLTEVLHMSTSSREQNTLESLASQLAASVDALPSEEILPVESVSPALSDTQSTSRRSLRSSPTASSRKSCKKIRKKSAGRVVLPQIIVKNVALPDYKPQQLVLKLHSVPTPDMEILLDSTIAESTEPPVTSTEKSAEMTAAEFLSSFAPDLDNADEDTSLYVENPLPEKSYEDYAREFNLMSVSVRIDRLSHEKLRTILGPRAHQLKEATPIRISKSGRICKPKIIVDPSVITSAKRKSPSTKTKNDKPKRKYVRKSAKYEANVIVDVSQFPDDLPFSSDILEDYVEYSPGK